MNSSRRNYHVRLNRETNNSCQASKALPAKESLNLDGYWASQFHQREVYWLRAKRLASSGVGATYWSFSTLTYGRPPKGPSEARNVVAVTSTIRWLSRAMDRTGRRPWPESSYIQMRRIFIMQARRFESCRQFAASRLQFFCSRLQFFCSRLQFLFLQPAIFLQPLANFLQPL